MKNKTICIGPFFVCIANQAAGSPFIDKAVTRENEGKKRIGESILIRVPFTGKRPTVGIVLGKWKKKFTLCRNDKVFVFFSNDLQNTRCLNVKVDFFQMKHMRYIDIKTGAAGFVVFYPRSFYAAGYDQGAITVYRYITVKKKWHYPFALIAEFIRLKFTNK